MKYKLKLNYTENELRELKELGKALNSPMTAVSRVVKTGVKIQPYEFLWRKYRTLDSHKEFDFMADINNAVMGTAIFPEKKYNIVFPFRKKYKFLKLDNDGDYSFRVDNKICTSATKQISFTMEEIKKIDGRLIPFAVEVKE